MARWSIAATVGLLVATASTARANPEPVALYDARSVGMAGTGVAFMDNASAIFHNPASLERIDRGSATLVLTPFFPKTEAPFAGRDTEGRSVQETNSGRIAPLFFAGAAGRVAEQVVVGLGAYVFTGIGSRYGDVDAYGGEAMDLEFAAGEFSLPVSLQINDQLSIGVAARLLYAMQETDVYDPARRGRVRQDLDGFGFPGFLLGVLFRPTSRVSLGLTYRSPVTIELDGKTRVDTAVFPDEPLPTRSQWRVPHAVRLGGAYELLEERLLLALEMKLQFHGPANERQVYRVDISGTDAEELLRTNEIEEVVALDWRNTLSGMAGAEYRIKPWLPVRLGYSFGFSSTPRHRVSPFMPPPGLLQAVYAGAGVRLGRFDLDIGGSYAFGKATVRHETPTGDPGRYRVQAFFGSLSVSYRI